MSNRIAVVDNNKLKDLDRKKHIQSLCPVNRSGRDCMYFEGEKLLIDERSCIGCGICVNAAPQAIHIINLPEQWNKQPIHRYGKNEFVLYNLPTPMFGKVVGILGRNGMGKSTAIKILSGLLQPNLGGEKAVSWDLVIDYFKGTEAQSYFEKVKKGEIIASYKPQQVDLIPKSVSGSVSEVLKKVDEKGIFETLVKDLAIEHILDNDIKTLSGGELQRVAIAASVMKKANVYVFDEPTSFLDIKQRIRVAKFIRGLADENTAVLVVEHDLIILDYMTDLVHITYGKEGVYGAISHPLSTRSGMNSYLEGYLKDENMRFRDKKITFEKGLPSEAKNREKLTSWKGIKKDLDSFSLVAETGEVYKKEVIGVLGENGIGKTTFVKILCDVIKPDSGEVETKIKVSYKPQYIETESSELVMSILSEAIAKHKNQIVIPLNIEPLLLKQINQLSGGELQRVAIAKCLSEQADLYLLDEPSAYLDVEQRLLISKVLKDFMSLQGKTAIVVDHDLLFIDYLSDEVLVFQGNPGKLGKAQGPYSLKDGMNLFLEELKLTFRRDAQSNRPRANKPGSQMDADQIKKNQWYA